MSDYFINEIGEAIPVNETKSTDGEEIKSKIQKFKDTDLSTEKRYEDINKIYSSYKFQLGIWSMVGGISILTLLMIIRKL